MKKDYLEDLKDELEESPILKEEMYRIVHKYEDLYEQYMDEGLSPSEVEEKLGNPKMIVSRIMKTKKQNSSPFDSSVYFTGILVVILYLMVGYFTSIWHPTWLIFLCIPAFVMLKKR